MKAAPPLRKVALRPDGRGWCIAVREAASTIYRYLGTYDSEGAAWQAFRDGVGLEPREDREEMRLEVRCKMRRAT